MIEDDIDLKHYLGEISKAPLLTPKEEKELARKIKRGDKAAREKMIKSNLRLVISIAKKYRRLGLSLLDLAEEGNLGLMKAVEKYDLRKGCKFGTYASWWIRQAITRALANQGKLIRLPVYLSALLTRTRKVANQLRQELGREPRTEEIAKTMKVPVQKIKIVRNISDRHDSLDTPVGEEGSVQLMDLISDMSESSAATQVKRMIEHEMAMHYVNALPKRETEVLKLRFGLEDGIFRTLEEVGEELNLTRERIRQIENSALRKLRTRINPEDKG